MFFFLFLGCGSYQRLNPYDGDFEGYVGTLSISPQKVILDVGQTVALDASVTPPNIPLVWTSLSPSIAEVVDGQVLGVKTGETTALAHVRSDPVNSASVEVVVYSSGQAAITLEEIVTLPNGRDGVFFKDNLVFGFDVFGLSIFDISTPGDPAQLYVSSAFSFSCNDLVVDGDWAFLGENSGVSIVSLSNPSSPANAGFIPTPKIRSVVLSEPYLYCLTEVASTDPTSNPELLVVDITNKGDPKLVSRLTLSGTPQKIDSSQDFVYITDALEGFRIVDVSVPSSPQLKGYYSDSGIVNLSVDFPYVFLVDSEEGLKLMDVSNADSPVLLSVLAPETSLSITTYWDVVLQDTMAYLLAARAFGSVLVKIDVSNPSSPLIIGSSDFPKGANFMSHDGNTIVTIDVFRETQILRLP